MQDHFLESFLHKYNNNSNNFHLYRNVDPYAVQPWEKNTIQIQIKLDIEDRKYKTFHQTPLTKNQQIKKHLERAYFTQNQFHHPKFEAKSLRKVISNQKKEKNTKIRQTKTQRMSVKQYNLNGSFQYQNPKFQERRFPNQFYMKRVRLQKDKQRDLSIKGIKQRQFEENPRRISVNQLKKRISINQRTDQIENQHFIRLNSQNDEQKSIQLQVPIKGFKDRRMSKVISLGYQKIAHIKSLSKQQSLNL